MRASTVMALLLALGVAAPAGGAEVKPESGSAEPGQADEVRSTDAVVVTATKVDTPGERLGAAVTVLTAEEFRTFDHTAVEEALRQVPGVEIQRAGGFGKASAIRIRGASPNQVQVLVDGMRVKSPTLGSADLAEFTLDAVDRIEIVRGPQSTLYGADAIGGVVNIITRKGQGPPSGFVQVEGGSHGTFRERLGVQGALGGFNVNLSGTRTDTSGQFDNDDAGQTSLAGRIGYDFPWKAELSLTGRYSRTTSDVPVHSSIPPPTVFDPNAQQQLETVILTAAYAQPITSFWTVRARYGYWSNHSGFQDSPPPPPPAATFPDDTLDAIVTTRRHEVELVNVFTPAPWTTVTAGFEYRRESGTNRTDTVFFGFPGVVPTRLSETIETLSGFLQQELRFLDRLFLTGSVRYEDSDAFESALTGRVAAALLIPETNTRLRGTWGQGFRAPTINDLFFPNFGNPDLQPERSESWDVGLDQRLWQGRVRLGATYFENAFTDLIQFTFTPPSTFRPENVGRARSRGFEVYLEADPLEWLTLYANYTNLSTRDRESGRPLRRFPTSHWNAGLVVTPCDGLSLFAQAMVVSKQFEDPTAGRTAGYHRIDVGGTWRILGRQGIVERLELTARVENVTDQDYAEVFGFPALGITALVGLRAQFQ